MSELHIEKHYSFKMVWSHVNILWSALMCSCIHMRPCKPTVNFLSWRQGTSKTRTTTTTTQFKGRQMHLAVFVCGHLAPSSWACGMAEQCSVDDTTDSDFMVAEREGRGEISRAREKLDGSPDLLPLPEPTSCHVYHLLIPLAMFQFINSWWCQSPHDPIISQHQPHFLTLLPLGTTCKWVSLWTVQVTLSFYYISLVYRRE